jgi:glycosyltransferase involved in cell wall biosynthesis
LIHLKFPQYFSVAQRAYARFMVGQAAHHAGAVITSSMNTKSDLVNLFGIAEERVRVVHLGISEAFRPINPARIERFRKEYDLATPYLLFVGNVKQHKNLATLLRAFSRVRLRHPGLRLVFVGGKCLQDQTLARLARELGVTDFIRDLGRISEEDVLGAYNAAEMLVFPSLYEGFGFPVLEAMACGIPTVVSTGGSLPEVAGDASILCDPHTPDAFVEAVEILLSDSARRAALVKLGLERAKLFSWRETAKQTLTVYARVLEQCNAN